MAKPKNPGGKRAPDRRRRPGESPEAWTVRNAYLSQNPGSGRWIIHYTEAVETPDGRVTYRTNQQACFTTDKAEAHERLTEWSKARLTPVKATGPKLTFVELVTRYLADAKRTNFSASNRYSLKAALEFFHHDNADAITRDRLHAYTDDLRDKGHAPGTIRQKASTVMTVLRYGKNHDMLPPNAVPTYTAPKGGAPRAYVLTPEQTGQVFRHAAHVYTQDAATGPEARAALFTCVAIETAQRRDAILAITWDRIYLTPGHEAMDFRRPGREPRNKRAAIVPIAPNLLPVIRLAASRAEKDANGDPTGDLFDSARLWQAFDRLREAVGLPDLTPHVFRHTWATNRIKQGMPIELAAKLLGDNPETIWRNYSHLNLDDVREAMRKYL